MMTVKMKILIGKKRPGERIKVETTVLVGKTC